MKLLVISISIFVLTFFISPRYAGAKEPIDRFEKVANHLVKAINEMNHDEIRRDFGEVMQDSFPLERSKPFFKNLSAQYGKIEKLDSGRLIPPDQATFPAHFERVILDIKIVLDDQDKIVGLWFLPHTVGDAFAEKDATEVPGIADSNAADDPNAVRAGIKELAGLEEALEELESRSERVCGRCHRALTQGKALGDLDSRSERVLRNWIPSRTDNKPISSLVKAMQEQVEAEFTFIRKLAVEEGAEKAAAAIDALVLARQELFEKIAKKMQEQKRSMRLSEREEKRGRDRNRQRGLEGRGSRRQPSRRDTREQDEYMDY